MNSVAVDGLEAVVHSVSCHPGEALLDMLGRATGLTRDPQRLYLA